MKTQKKIILLLMLILLMITATACMSPSNEELKAKIKEKLYEEYGEEFVVDRIGSRSSRGQKFYQARFYPKSIVGTSKEKDDYYHGEASIEKELFGFSGVGDDYGEIRRNIEIEKELLGKVKKLFGKRTLLKVEQRYEKRNSNGYFVSYLDPSYEEVMKRIEKEPNNHRLLLELYVYVFDRIEDKTEKEKRRKDIFEFVQYLKDEGLFEYLEMGVIFIDERALASSYDRFSRKIFFSDKVEKVVEGEKVELPPMKLRTKMSKELQKEINQMSEKELLANMKEIKKEELSYENLDKYYATHYGFIYSVGMLKEKYGSSYEEYKKKGTLGHYYYKEKSEVKIGENLEYILK